LPQGTSLIHSFPIGAAGRILSLFKHLTASRVLFCNPKPWWSPLLVSRHWF